MRSRLALLLVMGALPGCAVEHGNTPPPRAQTALGSPHAGRDSAPGPLHAVFQRRRDTVAVDVIRETVSVVLPGAERSAARALLEAVADDARHDTTVAALRVLGYLPPAQGHGDLGGPGLVPFVYLEWVPAGGWDAVSTGTAHAAHRTDVVFMEDLHRGLGRDEPQ